MHSEMEILLLLGSIIFYFYCKCGSNKSTRLSILCIRNIPSLFVYLWLNKIYLTNFSPKVSNHMPNWHSHCMHYGWRDLLPPSPSPHSSTFPSTHASVSFFNHIHLHSLFILVMNISLLNFLNYRTISV